MSLQELDNSSRQKFIPQLLDWLDELDPAICIHWDTSDQFPSESGKFLDIKSVLYTELVKRLQQQEVKWDSDENSNELTGNEEKAMIAWAVETAAKWYDYILEYDPAKNTVFFWDEVGKMPEEDVYMREELAKLDIQIKDASDNNLVPILLSTDTVKSTSGWMLPDKVFLQMVEKIIWEKWKRVCIIIDKANLFIHQEWKASASNERIHNESIVVDLIKFLREHDWSHFLLIDRNNSLNWELKQEIPFIEVPTVTRSDIEDLLKWVVDLQQHPEVLHFATWTRVRDLRRFIRDTAKKWKDKFISSLIQFKEQQINTLAGWAVKCSFKRYGKEQVAMSEEEADMWVSLALQLKKQWEFLPQAIMLVWPPWTWKSIRARLLASEMWVPYMELDDIWWEWLAWRKLQKVRAAFESAKRNKPCVLFIDEIDKALPRTEWNRSFWWGRDNDDAEVAAYIQSMLNSDEMRWVIMIAAANDPDQMNEALLRSWRFWRRVAILTPKTASERAKVFRAVWNQFDSLKDVKPDNDFVNFIASKSENATWADFKEILERAWMDAECWKFNSIHEAILHHLNKFSFEKSERYEALERKALNLRTVFFDDKEEDGDVESDDDITTATTLLKMKQTAEKAMSWVKNLEIQKQSLEQEIWALKSESQNLQWELDNIQERLASKVKKATKWERIKLADRFKEIRKQLRDNKKAEKQLKDKELEINSRDQELTQAQEDFATQVREFEQRVQETRDQTSWQANNAWNENATTRTFNLNVESLWAEATERASRLFWEIEQVTWDRLVSILRFNDILQEI